MSGKFKAMGLALLAVFAMSAIAAQGASAAVEHEFVAGEGGKESVVITGHGESHIFKAQGQEATCETATFAGTVKDENKDGVVDKVTVHPTYEGVCTFSGITVDVNTKGCNYVFDSDTTVTGVEKEHASVEIECEGTHVIEITRTGCRVKMEPNRTYDGIVYEHGGGSGTTTDLVVVATVTGITYDAVGIGCPLIGLTVGTHHDGSYEGAATVEGYEDTGERTGTTTEGTVFTHGGHVPLSITTP